MKTFVEFPSPFQSLLFPPIFPHPICEEDSQERRRRRRRKGEKERGLAVESVEEKEERNCSTGNSLDSNREKEEEIGATSTLCFRFSHRRSKREGKREGGGEPRFIAAPSIVVPEGRGVYCIP